MPSFDMSKDEYERLVMGIGNWEKNYGELEPTCPRCKDKVVAVRNDLDMFECTNPDCGWVGSREDLGL